MKKIINSIFGLIILSALFLTSCGSTSPSSDRRPVILTSTTFLADIARNIAGDRLTVESLLPIGVDPHAYQPTPQDAAKVADSKLLIVNGMGYEQFIAPLLENAGGERKVIEASAGISPREDAGGEQGVDPHMWLDPNLVIRYVENIRDGLIKFDPDGEAVYRSNAEAYIAQLKELDTWIVEQISQIPAERKLLITNHEALGYFAERYGFTIAGAVIESFSSGASPSAGQMADLIAQIKASGAPAIFLDASDNEALARQIAAETNVRVVTDLHLESLTDGAPAATYIDMMKHNVTRIVEALK
ncbi:MAG: metal ABC transporter substrate-binding protein [Chloroflexota bacterium]|nr:zinc ABC transporter substrate-binding protein [Chloroflexota bacterium]MBI5703063.1 zinc ABC transporter substrate-binding protein [Chloroflexota bacterium]